MCKRKRPKYKVGDILQEWYKTEWEWYYMVMEVKLQICRCRRCDTPKGMIPKHYEWDYLLKDMTDGSLDYFRVISVDMKGKRSARGSKFIGFRRVG